MKLFTKKIIFNKLNLKIYSLILGYSLWSIVSPYFTIERTYSVPMCFFPENKTIIHSPETLSITLRGTRKQLATIDPDSLAVHIETSALQSGKHLVTITPDMMFLPRSISVVHYNPSNCHINVQTS